MIKQILKNHTSQETAYEVQNYPYGRLRTSMFYWIESVKGKGDRFVSMTRNPKTGKLNNPHKGTYSPFKYLYLDEIGHVQCGGVDSYETDKFKEKMDFLLNEIGEENILDIQKANLRHDHAIHRKVEYGYRAVKYSEERKKEYHTWMGLTLKHILTAPFKDIADYENQPVYDCPEKEVEFTVTTITNN